MEEEFPLENLRREGGEEVGVMASPEAAWDLGLSRFCRA
jgi:hypothetical protein